MAFAGEHFSQRLRISAKVELQQFGQNCYFCFQFISWFSIGLLNPNHDLATVLSFVTSAQDLVSGPAFSLLLFAFFSLTFNVEIIMETDLFTVFQAVKSERASLWGLKRRADSARDN